MWLGTGTVIVPLFSLFCITIWLPRCLTSAKPCLARIAHTDFPESTRNLPNRNLQTGDVYLFVQALFYFIGRGRFEE